MKPLKNGLVFANWLMRISLLVLLVALFYSKIAEFEVNSKAFYIALSFGVFGLLLFIGGFMSKPSLTVVSGFILSALSVYKIILLFSGSFNSVLATFLIVLSVSFYFVCSGNN